jgi:hypothetical protein
MASSTTTGDRLFGQSSLLELDSGKERPDFGRRVHRHITSCTRAEKCFKDSRYIYHAPLIT